VTTNNKDFDVQNGLDVNGPATLGSTMVIDSTPISIDSQTNRLKVNVNNTWLELAMLSDIPQAVVNNIEVQYDGN
jgi:hypothetical protein